jgi:hypothetical protein
MVDIQTASIAIASASVVAGIIYYSLQIRHQTKAFGGREMRQAWEKITTRECRDFSTYQKEFGLSDINEVGWFFEGVGILLHRKLIDIAVVDDLFSSPIKISWEKMKPLAEGERKKFGRPQIWEWWEYLYNEMQKREQKLQQSKA